MLHPDPIYPIVCALALAVVLASAASHKLRAPQRFARQLEDYALVPQALLPLLTRLVPLLEAALALGLLLPACRAWAAVGAALLLIAYAAAIGIIHRFHSSVSLDSGRAFSKCHLCPWLPPLTRIILKVSK